MKNSLLPKIFILFFCLTVLVYFAFSIHRMLPFSVHFIYPVLVLISIGLFYYYLDLRLKNSTNFYLLNNILPIVTVIPCILFLYKLSSCHRLAEAQHYLSSHRQELLNIIHTEQEKKDKKAIDALLSKLNISTTIDSREEYHFELYNFIGYGYRLMYTEKSMLTAPVSPGGSPTVNWYKLEDHWYYYSYFD